MPFAIVFACCFANGLEASAQDIVVVRPAAVGPWGAPTRLIKELEIGQLEGDEQYTFGAITGVAVGRDGAIFVADRNPTSIRMFDDNGKFVRAVGKQGGGPGEYYDLSGIASVSDGSIGIWDARNGRITVYDPKGELKATHVVQSAQSGPNSFAVDRNGNFYVRGTARNSEPSTDPNYYWLKVNPRGVVIDTLPIPRAQSDPTFRLETPGGDMRPFTRMTVSTFSTLGYIVRGRNDEYSIDLLRPTGGVLRIIGNYTPVRVGRGERTQWEETADGFKRFVMSEQARAASSKGAVNLPTGNFDFKIPETKPPFRNLKVDDDGRIWVTRYVEAVELPQAPRKPGDNRAHITWREPETFDVFEPSGRSLGQVALPIKTWLMSARGSHLWVVRAGDQDEQYIVRYRIEPAR